MTSKNGWEKSSSGPDWIDLENLMRAIEGLHSARVALIVRPDGTGLTGGVMVEALCNFDVLPGSSLPDCVVTGRAWPCKEHKTFTDHAFAVMYDLDAAIGKVYTNEKLWE